MKTLLLSLLICALALPLLGQYERPAAPAGVPRTAAFGTVGEGAVAVSFAGFTPVSSSEPYTDSGGNRYNPNGSGTLLSSISLPNGVLITGLELMACDNADPGDVGITLFVREPLVYTGLASVFTPAGTPGCGNYYFQVPAGTEPVVNSGVNSYFLVAFTSQGDGTTTLNGARVFYRRQVSPAPAVATFADVPTNHGFFKFVEALAAAGITGGCGGGNYCPNNPVTRGQMAVFLASALGLHWPAN